MLINEKNFVILIDVANTLLQSEASNFVGCTI